MAVSADLKIKKRRRQKQIRRKQIRTVFVGVFLLFIIIFLTGYVKGIFEKKAPDPEKLAESLLLYPMPKEKTTDILASLPNNDGIKTAYLTFDDGPTNAVTPGILDILRRYDIKATFFMTGQLIDKNPGLAYRVFSEGHTLANHSYQHDYSYLYESEENFMSEIDKTYSSIIGITNKENYPKIFRFPGGGYNSGSYGEVKQDYKEALKKAGYRYVDWNALSGDAETKSPSANALLKRVKSSSKGKEDIVILMHDSATKKVNLTALPSIIEYLRGEGYIFDTLDHAQ